MLIEDFLQCMYYCNLPMPNNSFAMVLHGRGIQKRTKVRFESNILSVKFRSYRDILSVKCNNKS